MTQVVAPTVITDGTDAAEVRAGLVARAKHLFPLLRKNARTTDHDRCIPQENLEAIKDAGIFRLWVPKRYGGYETDMRTQIDVAAELSRACGSTGWVVALITACGWAVSLFSEEAQDEVFGADPDTRVCAILSPSGVGKEAPGGFVLNGSWAFATGSLHCDWAALTTPMVDHAGNVVNVGLMLAPMAELQVKDTWFTVGMRGTGSNTVVAEGVFVPQHRVLPLLGPSGDMDPPVLTPYKDESLYRVSLGSLVSLAEVGCPLGLARAGLETALEQLPKRSIAYTTYEHQTEAVSTQLELAEAATKIDAAELIVHRAASDADSAAARDVILDTKTRARIRMDCGWATRTVREAADLLVMMCGASSMAEVNYLQQVYRDITTVTLHALLRPSVMLELYGRVLCGLDPAITPVL
jgi:alkylation response protein AidB-like acyl-CoA dehydrogenase